MEELELRAAGYADPTVADLCAEQQRELRARYRDTEPVPQIIRPGIEFLVAWRDGEALGCAGLQVLEPGVGELKRMYVRAAHRGRGLSRVLLTAVEDLARERDVRTLRLEMGARQPEALGLYTGSGFAAIPRFGPYVDCAQSLCFAKAV